LPVRPKGIFAASEKKISYIALYIKKAAQYRLPNKIPENRAPVLLPVDPTRTGWLMDKWRLNEGPCCPACSGKKVYR
jgi:hypothetical protein